MKTATILIADDEVALRFLLSETLVDEGYEVQEASDGQEALDQLKSKPFDLIILDYMMPELTGVEVCEWLRGMENPNQHTPVILLTAKAQEKDRERARDVGVSRYMIKPFSPLQLLDVIAELLEPGES
ncbi:response regulator [Brevibacillus fluminis]|uniref:Response regulator n=1 Tax=Brevibacillus fluminis TaxID=511487 RepID=A0A3M8DWQ6_9BACL|nr:response regulator [Brevibacillus fluminis]RNB91955.1 response regulator [Brevibacillus fluminis]